MGWKEIEPIESSVKALNSSTIDSSSTTTSSSTRVHSGIALPVSAYNPLSYRAYKSTSESFSLIQHIKSKVRHTIKHNFACDNLLLQLSSDESKKLKEIASKSTSLSSRWASDVKEEKSDSEKSYRIRLQYLTDLLKHLDDITANTLSATNSGTASKPPIKTYSRASKQLSEAVVSKPINCASNTSDENCDLNQTHQKPAVMDDYEVFCEKESNLRKLLDAFPGADIMEAQDILVDCQWDLEKAMATARIKPLRTTKKRSLSNAQMDSVNSPKNENDANPTPHSGHGKNAEEIVLDSSDEENEKFSNVFSASKNDSGLEKQGMRRKRQRLLSSDSEDEIMSNHSSSNVSDSQSSSTQNVLPKSVSAAQSNIKNQNSDSSAQKSIQLQQPNAQKSMQSQQPNLQKLVQSQQHGATSTKPNSNTSVPEKSIPSSLSISIKPSQSANSGKDRSPESESPESLLNLPKWLVVSKVPASNSSDRPQNETKSSKMSSNGNIKNDTDLKSEVSNVSSQGNVNSRGKMSAHVVRITTNNSLSVTATDKSKKSGIAINDSPNSTLNVPTKNHHSINSNSVSITPVSKSLTVTPVSTNMSHVQHLDKPSKGLSNKSIIKSKDMSHKSSNSKAKHRKVESEEDDEEYGNEDFYDSEDSDCEENLTAVHSNVLKFFQEASVEELSGIPGCSKKKVEAIVNARPFNKWADLVEKLRNDKNLSTDMLNGAKKVLDMRATITKLMTKCQQLSVDMEDLVENLKENKESSTDYVGKQPDLLNNRMHLTAYQLLGLNWLLLLHNQEVNGILADEMGLGKTVQAIAFLAYLKEIESAVYPHLIVVPSSTLDNWKKELETWWPDVSVICYHGSQDNRRELRMQIMDEEIEDFDVMITTYNMVTSSAEDRNFFKNLQFHYVVFDEAHMLKNMSSQRYQNLMRIKAPRRLLLTGTPLQNNLVELMSLLIFAMPHMFSGKIEQIKQMFSCVSRSDGNKSRYEKDRIDHAKKIMKPFVLRRLKKDVLKELPQKIDETRRCSMTEDQSEKYKQLVATFSAEVESDQERTGSSSGAGMMMQLRKAANHPLLLRHIYDDDKLKKMSKLMLNEPTHFQADPNLVFEDMGVMSDFELHKLCKSFKSLAPFILPDEVILNSGKFKVLDSLLPNLIEQDHRILLFSQFTMVLDIVEGYMNIKGYKFLRLDGQVPVPERQQLIDDFNSDPEISVFLLSTRAGGLGINLTSADTVILHDIDFNPYNDKQAEDRCHRVGQIRDVTVIRLISENTIEEGILQRATEKLKLERDIHDQDDTEESDSASVAMLLRDALGLKSKS
ncbi:SWI/SNF-related matrix-associated actin-dependent regulator of chromatin subfamily A containing DEAD/H box 1 homolog [Uloborus diversus]|uniref:SWI/SNF-related matrix-associated actin-dependent regulator of chromatin subfamily A containing DEAD/H box 1 homolog n=1 Tax=Uloborus diversus TaxID=327109 RepID=UPI002409A1FD|nr:SWI/SNF-related matrix-associated actin-dependent regulator of chromatin subfamily A containing DEAD/H box 1 homolog [Uloborus diversus]